jgi:hypothetical protein
VLMSREVAAAAVATVAELGVEAVAAVRVDLRRQIGKCSRWGCRTGTFVSCRWRRSGSSSAVLGNQHRITSRIAARIAAHCHPPITTIPLPPSHYCHRRLLLHNCRIELYGELHIGTGNREAIAAAGRANFAAAAAAAPASATNDMVKIGTSTSSVPQPTPRTVRHQITIHPFRKLPLSLCSPLPYTPLILVLTPSIHSPHPCAHHFTTSHADATPNRARRA